MIIFLTEMYSGKKFLNPYAMGKQITRPKMNSMRKLERGGWAPRTKIQVKARKIPKGIQVLVFSKVNMAKVYL